MSACPGSLSKLRVLVVEDEMLISMLIEGMLEDQNCEVVGPCENIVDAVELARTAEFDFALLDVNVGGRKVYPVAELVSSRGIPFLFLSGYGQTAVPTDRPDWRVCSKPFRSDQLVEMMVSQLQGAKVTRGGAKT